MFGEKGSHFYDLIRWIFETNIHSVFAFGDALFDPEFKAINQPDTAVVLMRLETGVLCSLNFSWRSGYGHDERLEISGSNGAIHSVQNSDAAYQGYGKGKFSQIEKFPNWNEIFHQTYRDELDFFISEARSNVRIKLPTLFDGVQAQKVADAITLKKTNRPKTAITASVYKIIVATETDVLIRNLLTDPYEIVHSRKYSIFWVYKCHNCCILFFN